MSQEIKHTRIGRVVSNKMDKTAVVLLQRRSKHPLIGKVVTKSNKIKIHDPSNALKIGDVVEIMDGRPISKDKSWKLIKVLDHN